MKRRNFALGLAVLLAASSVRAQTTVPSKWNFGDPAPAFTPGTWLKGEPVTKLERGKIYVVEFWATWCGPCREAMPHLTELAKKHPDVTFIGQDVFEQDDDDVKPFVEKNAQNMGYHIAADDKTKVPDGAMQTAWLTAGGIDSIPTTFLVDKEGKIAWIGRPPDLEEVLDQVLAGTYDPKAAAAKEKKLDELQARVDKAAAAKDLDALFKATKDLVDFDKSMAEPVMSFEFSVLLDNGKLDEARTRAETLSKTSQNPIRLNGVAWQLASLAQPSEADLKIARAATDRAMDLTGRKEPAVFDTSARLYADAKDWDKAVDQQSKAVALADDAQMKAALQASLDAYQKHQLPANQ